ncbi:MAG: hypothetical protein IH619_06655 [Ignavibacterium sp.]|nr:hypothetical protein [Ignavibacterium sp.]
MEELNNVIKIQTSMPVSRNEPPFQNSNIPILHLKEIILQIITVSNRKILFLKVGKALPFNSSHLKYFFVYYSNSSFLGLFAWYYYWVKRGT